MPVVTVDENAFERHELKTAPADPNVPGDEAGYVMLRPLPYGMKLSRRSKATKMMMRSKPVQNRKQAQEQDQVFELESHDEWAMAHDFAYCIGTHNLQNPDGSLIDFTRPMSLKMLDPRVGSEIETLIDKLNNDDDEEAFEDFLLRSNTPSTAEVDSSKTDGLETQTQMELPVTEKVVS